MAIENLVGALNRLGKPSELLVMPDGSRLALLCYGARVLGLFAPDSEDNYYWTNPAIVSGDPSALFPSNGWHNSGGDRTWLAPESDLSFPMFPDINTYQVPCEIDPGTYERAGQPLSFVNRTKVRLFRSRQTVNVEISKSWGAAPNPLRYEEAWQQLSGAQYAGYTQRTRLRLLDGAAEAGPIAIWNLIQLPHSGEFYFPLHGDSEPMIYFGSILPGDIEAGGRAVRYKARASGIQKIGIQAAMATGRAGYSYSAADCSVLVVRNVVADPSAEYIDVPWSSSGELGRRGYLFQACNVNNELGSFSELEYHTPAIGRGTASVEREDVSQVWAFRGTKAEIRLIGQTLLSPHF